MASLLSFQGGLRVASYAASKHAVAGLTRALANEWAPHGVQVNAIAPGYITTDNTRALREDPHRHQAISQVESTQEPNTVVNVLQKGYMLNDRVLRPALVTVAAAPQQQS